jgi:hypothetical protein
MALPAALTKYGWQAQQTRPAANVFDVNQGYDADLWYVLFATSVEFPDIVWGFSCLVAWLRNLRMPFVKSGQALFLEVTGYARTAWLLLALPVWVSIDLSNECVRSPAWMAKPQMVDIFTQRLRKTAQSTSTWTTHWRCQSSTTLTLSSPSPLAHGWHRITDLVGYLLVGTIRSREFPNTHSYFQSRTSAHGFTSLYGEKDTNSRGDTTF